MVFDGFLLALGTGVGDCWAFDSKWCMIASSIKAKKTHIIFLKGFIGLKRHNYGIKSENIIKNHIVEYAC